MSKNRFWKRYLSLLLCTVLCIDYIPINVLAATGTHGHTDDCYTKALVCEMEEHSHGEACFDAPIVDEDEISTPNNTQEPACGLEAHTHKDSCYKKTLDCSGGDDLDKEQKVSVVSVENPEITRYPVELGTELKNVGLPKKLTAQVRESGKESTEEDSIRETEITVTWTGAYEANVAGEYILTAEFVDPELSFDSMPEVLVVVDEILRDTSTSARHRIQWVIGDNSVITGDQLDITPKNYAKKSVMAQVQFSRGGNDTVPADAIEIRVPAHILYGRDGEPVDKFEVPLSEDATGETGFYYYIDEHGSETKADDEIVMKNWREISSAYYFRCDIKYTYQPAQVADVYTKDDIDATFFTPDGEIESDQKLTIVNHTGVVSYNPGKNIFNKYEVWNSAWGEEPENSKDYFYIWWNVNQNVNNIASTQPFFWKVSEMAEPGIVVGGNIKNSEYSSEFPERIIKYLPDQDGTFQMESYISLDYGVREYPYHNAVILVKYPRTLLSALGEGETLSIINKAPIKIEGIDGFVKEYTPTSEGYIYTKPNATYPPGYSSAEKYANEIGNSVIPGFAGLTLLEKGKPAEVGYKLYAQSLYYESDTKEAGSVLELTEGTVRLEGQRLTPGEDYVFSKMRMRDASVDGTYFKQFHMIDDENYGISILPLENVDDYDSFDIYIKRIEKPDAWELYAEVSVSKINTFRPDYAVKYVDGREGTGDEPIEFPDGTISFKGVVNSTHHRTTLGIEPVISLLPSEKVLQLIKDKSTVFLNNEAEFAVYNLKGERKYQVFPDADAKVEHLRIDSRAEKDYYASENDVTNRRTKTRFSVDFSESCREVEGIDYSDYLNDFSQGSFYDLLPAGTTVENISVTPRFGATSSVDYKWNAEYVDNWQNSGRTMMILHITGTPVAHTWKTGINISYNMISTYENIADNGNQLDNYAAWIATNGKNFGSGKPDTYRPDPTDTPWDYFKDLNQDGESEADDKDTLYANTTATIQLPTSAEGGFRKYVSSVAESIPDASSITLKPDAQYSYKLRYQNDENSISSNLVMYDVLETAYDNNPYWQGTLTGVSTANATSKGAKVDVYYSTTEGIQPYGANGTTAEGDLSDSSLWSMTPPADLSQVTAVAFDLRKNVSGGDFTLTKNNSVYVEIFMKAIPKVADIFDTAATPDIKAYNQSGCQVTLDGTSTSTEPSNITTVEVKQVTAVNAEKIWDDTGATGTVDHSKDRVTLKLFADGVDTGKTLVLNQQNNWKGTFAALPAKTGENQAIVYTVKEVMSGALSGKYTVTYAYDSSKTDVNVSITNTLIQSGQLTVSKTVGGNAGDKNKGFAFTVTLGNTGINGAYGDMTFTRGTAVFTLKDGEQRTAVGLPEGTTYTVTENDYRADGYVTTKTGDTGTIGATTTQTAAFINTRDAFGRLTVSKELQGNDTDTGADFMFFIVLNDTTINDIYSGITFENGEASFSLKGGERKTMEGLPSGVGYKVTESECEGYTVTKTGDTGIIGEGQESVAAFKNTRNSYGDLTVTKTVTGNAGDENKDFAFTVSLGDSSINGDYGGMTFQDGIAVFTLRHQEGMTATGLPHGVSYTVKENDYTQTAM